MAVSTEFRPAGAGMSVRSTPREWEEGRLLLHVDADGWEELRLDIQGERQEVYGLRVGEYVVPAVDWPRRGAGHWRGRLIGPHLDERFEVSVLPKKLDAAAFDAMLVDLDERLPGSITHGLDRAGAFAGRRSKPPRPSTPAEELARLRRAIDGDETGPGLAHCLALVARDPHTTLVAEQPWTSVEHARRPATTALRAALVHPGNVRSADGILRLDRVFDTRACIDLDTPENRFLRGFTEEVGRRLRRVARSSNRGEEVARLGAVLERGRRTAAFLDGVGLPKGGALHPSMVLLHRPGYRDAHRRWLDLRRSSALEVALPLRDTSLENTPALYEIWASLVAIEALVALCLRQGWRLIGQSLVVEHGGWSFDLGWDGRTLLEWRHPDGRGLKVAAQRTFTPTTRSIRATSHGQRPDLVFELSRAERPPRLLILDPKYKLAMDDATDAQERGFRAGRAGGGPLEADLDKMHAYRDALRRPDGTTAVDVAYILFPGAENPWFADAPGRATGIGAIGLRPGIGTSAEYLETAFERWLEAADRPIPAPGGPSCRGP